MTTGSSDRTVHSGLLGEYLRSAGVLILGAVAVRGAALLAVLIAGRLLAPDEFGALTLIQGGVLTLSVFANLGISVAVVKQVAESHSADGAAAGRIAGFGLALSAGAGALIALAIVLLREPLSDLLLGSGETGASAVGFGGVALLALGVGLTGQAAALGVGATTVNAASTALQAGLSAAGLILGAALGNSASAAMAGFAAGASLGAVLSLAIVRETLLRRSVRLQARLDRSQILALLRISGPVLAAAASVALAFLAGQAFLARGSGGLADVAVFNVAYRWQMVLLFVPAAIAPLLLPMATRTEARTAGARKALYEISLRINLGICAAGAAILLALAPVAMSLSGSFYADQPEALRLLAAASVLVALNSATSSVALSLGLIGPWLLSDLALVAAFLIAAALLVPALGAAGLAIAHIVGFAATNAVLVPIVWRRLNLAR